MKIAHLLGNGPSRKDFVNDPPGDVFGCNLSDESLDLKATFVMDAVVLEHMLKTKTIPPWPIVMAHNLERLHRMLDPRPEILAIIPRVLRNGESTGHHAALWLIEHGYTHLHLWGFDSFFRDSVESDSQWKVLDSISCDKNAARWREKWIPLMRMCELTVHPPEIDPRP